MSKLFIVMPAYNEEKNIKAVVEEWYKKLDLPGADDDSRLVVADFGSTDTTHDILTELKERFRKLEILETDNQFHGPKVLALYAYAIKNGASYIFQTDSDGQTNPQEFDKFWNDRGNFDAIIGNRGGVRGDGKDRVFVEKVVCLLLRIYFGVKVPDANAPFRLMKAEMLEKYIDRIPMNYNIPNIVLTSYFCKFNEKVSFRNISFKPRLAGKNYINMLKITRIGLGALKDFRGFKKDMSRGI